MKERLNVCFSQVAAGLKNWKCLAAQKVPNLNDASRTEYDDDDDDDNSDDDDILALVS